MNCDDWTLQINALLDGALSPSEAAALAGHLNTCADCRRMLSEFASLRSAMAELTGAEEPSAALVGHVHALVDAPPGKVRLLRSRVRRGAGLAVAAALAATVLLMIPPAKDVQPDLMSVRDATLRTSLSTGVVAEAPAVPGFTLVSARQDFVAGHRAQVAVYRHGDAMITLCTWPAGRERAHGVINATYHGMVIHYWNDGRTEYWAASLISGPALPDFVQGLRGITRS